MDCIFAGLDRAKDRKQNENWRRMNKVIKPMGKKNDNSIQRKKGRKSFGCREWKD